MSSSFKLPTFSLNIEFFDIIFAFMLYFQPVHAGHNMTDLVDFYSSLFLLFLIKLNFSTKKWWSIKPKTKIIRPKIYSRNSSLTTNKQKYRQFLRNNNIAYIPNDKNLIISQIDENKISTTHKGFICPEPATFPYAPINFQGLPVDHYKQYYRAGETFGRDPHITSNNYHALIKYSDLTNNDLIIDHLDLNKFINSFIFTFSDIPELYSVAGLKDFDIPYNTNSIVLNFHHGKYYNISETQYQNIWNIQIPLISGRLRELAFWRLLPLFILPKSKVTILNGHNYNNELDYATYYNDEHLFSFNTYAGTPAFLRLVIGKSEFLSQHRQKFINALILYGGIYGSDEMFLHQFHCTTHIKPVHNRMSLHDGINAVYPCFQTLIFHCNDGSRFTLNTTQQFLISQKYYELYYNVKIPVMIPSSITKTEPLLIESKVITERPYVYNSHLKPVHPVITTSLLERIKPLIFVYIIFSLFYLFINYNLDYFIILSLAVLVLIGLNIYLPFILYHPLITKRDLNLESSIHPHHIIDPFNDLDDTSKYTLFVTNGTYGDMIPIYYLARLATKYCGSDKIAYYNLNHITSSELRQISNGQHWTQVPIYLKLQWLWKSGFKKLFLPFTHSPNGLSYTLSSSEKYIGPFNAGNTVLGIITSFYIRSLKPTFRIGNKDDCNIPRSTDGSTLMQNISIKRIKDQEKISFGYCTGSDTELEDKIIDRIMKDFPEWTREEIMTRKIIDTDHLKVFPQYRKIYCHGGNGTMETIAYCGGEAINCSSELDRNYLRPITPSDIKEVSIMPFLLYMMYINSSPIPLNWLIYYFKHLISNITWTYCLDRVYDLIALLLVPYNLISQINVGLLWLITLRPFTVLNIPKLYMSLIHQIIGVIMLNPICIIFPYHIGWLGFFGFIYLNRYNICQDISFAFDCYTHKSSRFWIQNENVKIGKVNIPGHVSIYDRHRGVRYEGKFLNKDGLHRTFKMVKHHTPQYRCTFSFEIPTMCRLKDLESLMSSQGNYSFIYNCQTLISQTKLKDTFFLNFPFLLTCFIGFILTSLWEVSWYLGIHESNRFFPYLGFINDENNKNIEEAFNLWKDKSEIGLDLLFPENQDQQSIILPSNINNPNNHLDTIIKIIHPIIKPFTYTTSSQYQIRDIKDLDLPDHYSGLTKDGIIYLDLDRNEAEIIETLIHEICHLDNPNHDRLFIETYNHLITEVKKHIHTLSLISLSINHPHLAEFTKCHHRPNMNENNAESVNYMNVTEIESLIKTFDTNPGIVEQSAQSTIDNIAFLINSYEMSPDTLNQSNADYLTRDELIDIGLDAIHKRYNNGLSEQKLNEIIEAYKIKPYKDRTYRDYLKDGLVGNWYSYFIQHLKQILEPVYNYIPDVRHFLDWLTDKLHFLSSHIGQILKNAQLIARVLWDYSKQLWYDFIALFNVLIDIIWPESHSKRIKTVWGLAGLINSPYISKRLQMEQMIAMMESQPRTNPIEDLKYTLDNINQFSNNNPLLLRTMTKYLNPLDPVEFHEGLPIYYFDDGYYITDTILEENDTIRPYINAIPLHNHLDPKHPLVQRLEKEKPMHITKFQRQVNLPIIATGEEESKLIGLNSQSFKIIPELTERTNEYLNFTNQGQDGVVLGQINSYCLAKATARYTPKYAPIDNEFKNIANMVADGIVEQFPDQFKDSKITHPAYIPYYLDPKLKYSTGLPFLAFLKKRRQLRELGFEEGLVNQTIEKMREGEYGNQLYHAFAKAQVVDQNALMKGKDLRTVTAQDLATYFIDQVVQIERNKRITWRDTGVGIGMILNQNMVHLFDQIQKFLAEGGVLIEADATQFDSRLSPYCFQVLKRLGERSFENHWKGKEINSVFECKYDKMQDAYIWNITDYPHDIFELGVENKTILKELLTLHPDKFITYRNFVENYENSAYLKDKIILTPNHTQHINEPQFILTNKIANNNNIVTFTLPPDASHSTFLKMKDQLLASKTNRIYLVNTDAFIPAGVKPYVDEQYIIPSTIHKARQQKIEVWRNLSTGKVNQIIQHIQQFKLPYLPDNISIEKYRAIPFLGQITKNIPQSYTDAKIPLFTKTGKDLTDHYNTAEMYRKNKDLMRNMQMKNRGGGTGQSATSFDNTWAFRGTFIAGWLEYFDWKYNVRDFFRLNKLFNNGDDSIWACRIKRKDMNMAKFIDAFHKYGMDLEVEIHTDLESVQYLGNKVFRLNKKEHPDVFRQHQLFNYLKAKSGGKTPEVHPNLLVYHDVGASLLRRTSFRYYQSSITNHVYLTTSLMRSVGQASLTAWNPDLYRMIANEYISDIHNLARLNRVKPPKIYIETDQKLENKDRYFIQVHFDKQKPCQSMKKREYDFWCTMRNFKFPTYYQVLNIQMRLREEDVNKYDYYYKKFLRGETIFSDIPNMLLDETTWFFQSLPRQVYKYQPTILTLFPDPTFFTHNKYTEKFIYISNYCVDEKGNYDPEKAKNLPIPTSSGFNSLVQQSPLGGCCDAYSFIYNLQNNYQEYTEEILAPGGDPLINPLRVYSNLNIISTTIYICLYYAELWIMGVPVLNFLWNLMIKLFIDLPKIYAIGNAAYWHRYGKSSGELSAIIPRDLYIQMKRFSVFLGSWINPHYVEFLPFYYIVQSMADISHAFARLIRKQQSAKEQSYERASENHQNVDYQRWVNLLSDTSGHFYKSWSNLNTAMVLTSGTGTGKSSRFPFSLYIQRHLYNPKKGNDTFKMIILVPRKILRENFKVDGTATFHQTKPSDSDSIYFTQILKKGIQIDNSHNTLFYVATYGHFLQRFENDIDLRSICANNIIMFDEFHELSMDMLATYDIIRTNNTPHYHKLILSSATPQSIPEIPSISVPTGFPDRFKKTLIKCDDDNIVNQVNWFSEFPEYKDYHDEDGKILIRYPFINKFAGIKEGLESGIPRRVVHELTRDNADQPIPTNKVILASNIINAGIDIPNRRVMFDTGLTIGNDRNIMRTNIPTSEAEFQQISGRIGRHSDGIYVYHPRAGTGPVLKPYGSLKSFTSLTATSHMQVPQLLTYPVDSNLVFPEVPYISFIQNDQVKNFSESIKRILILLIHLYADNINEKTIYQIYNDLSNEKEGEELDNYYQIIKGNISLYPNIITLLKTNQIFIWTNLMKNNIKIKLNKNTINDKVTVRFNKINETENEIEYEITTLQYKEFVIGPWTNQETKIESQLGKGKKRVPTVPQYLKKLIEKSCDQKLGPRNKDPNMTYLAGHVLSHTTKIPNSKFSQVLSDIDKILYENDEHQIPAAQVKTQTLYHSESHLHIESLFSKSNNRERVSKPVLNTIEEPQGSVTHKNSNYNFSPNHILSKNNKNHQQVDQKNINLENKNKNVINDNQKNINNTKTKGDFFTYQNYINNQHINSQNINIKVRQRSIPTSNQYKQNILRLLRHKSEKYDQPVPEYRENVSSKFRSHYGPSIFTNVFNKSKNTDQNNNSINNNPTNKVPENREMFSDFIHRCLDTKINIKGRHIFSSFNNFN